MDKPLYYEKLGLTEMELDLVFSLVTNLDKADDTLRGHVMCLYALLKQEVSGKADAVMILNWLLSNGHKAGHPVYVMDRTFLVSQQLDVMLNLKDNSEHPVDLAMKPVVALQLAPTEMWDRLLN